MSANTYHIYIPGAPLAQPRARAVRTGTGVRMYDPAHAKRWKERAATAMKFIVRKPLAGPVYVRISAVFPCPESDHRKLCPRPERWHTKHHGDIDNIAKAVLDAANGVLFRDDRQVCQLVVTKTIAAQGDDPHVNVIVNKLKGGP